ncbi:MAG TPA: Tex family protein [Bacteroidales bacterium]|nr:Tex family protein [Bacteroidales bacterium]
MNQIYISHIAHQEGISHHQISKTIQLLLEGATVPFISRYRKEITGGLDEVQVANIKSMYDMFSALDERKQTILKSITEQDALTPELEKKIRECIEPHELEDLYLPYKPKRKTRASIAKEKGFEPLARYIYAQKTRNFHQEIKSLFPQNTTSVEDALQYARDIIAEWINEDSAVRACVRGIFQKHAIITTKLVKGKETEAEKYTLFFDFSERLRKSPSHRILAIMRAHKEGIIRVSISVETDMVISALKKRVLRGYNDAAQQCLLALTDAYTRLIAPSIETEFYADAKKRADASAIQVFAQNLEQLLLLPPLGQKRILGIDPGFKSGCKLVCVDECGTLLHNETIYPHPPQNEKHKASKKLAQLVETYKIQAIAVGNGTASRETEMFIQNSTFPHKIQVFMVNEAGASVYSASKVAREEFPQYDVTVRGAVSIARRLMDPLAELVKIDPKSIGVGQYQHDVNQTDLQKSLDNVVTSCVNKVGVELNTASKHLLAYVSGVGPALAEHIVTYRTKHGAFTSRNDLLQVPKMGVKTFEQCAGFLRIRDAEHVLDTTAVHPERYALVHTMAQDLKTDVACLLTSPELRKKIVIDKYVSDDVGLPTLKDILAELEKPGRDPREKVSYFSFDTSLKTIADLKTGMVVPGIITNITNFGAFVDIGITQNGLVHISQITHEFISSPAEVLRINQDVRVKIIDVDIEKKRIHLSIKDVQ